MLQERITNDYQQALKKKENIRVSTLSFLRAQFKNVMIEKKEKQLEDQDVISVIKKQIKQRQDAIEQYEKGGREDLVVKEKEELNILKTYLPEEMSEGELRSLISEVIQELEATQIRDMGRVMKTLLPKIAGRADNKIVSQMVKTALSG